MRWKQYLFHRILVGKRIHWWYVTVPSILQGTKKCVVNVYFLPFSFHFHLFFLLWATCRVQGVQKFFFFNLEKEAIYMKATNIWNRHLISSFPFPSWHGLCRKPFCYQLRLDNMYVHIHVICVCVWRRMLVKERMRLFYSQSIHVRQDSILSVNCLVLHCHCHNFF